MGTRRASIALVLVAWGVLPVPVRAQTAAAPVTYSARVEVRSGMCCSASCGAVSTLADLALTIAADGSATLHWVRAGCLVTITPVGDGPIHMPRDPGPPDAVCAMRGPGASVRVLDADVTQYGRWRLDGPGTVVTLDPSTTLRCAPTTIEGRVLLACTIDATGIDPTGLTLEGQLYLDARPGLVERLDESDHVAFARR